LEIIMATTTLRADSACVTPAPSAHPTRRQLLAAAPLTAAAIAIPAVAATGADATIMAAWCTRKAAFQRFNALPFDEPMAPDEAAEWAIIDAAEETIRSAVATTPAGAAVQLWTHLSHRLTKRADDEAAQKADLAYFADDTHLDWTERLTLAALRSKRWLAS
jgi:hypothetical protein